MATRSKTILLWFSMAVLLPASVGISVQQLYCYCVGKTTVSVFDDAIDACAGDQVDEDTGGCCKVSPPPCCAKTEPTAETEHGCTRKSVKIFRLQVEYLIGQPLDKTFECPTWADEVPDCYRLFRPVMCCASVWNNKAPPPLPPPPSGRTICLRHAVFRC